MLKKIFLFAALTVISQAYSHSLQKRTAYFIAPSVLILGYNEATRLFNNNLCHHELDKWLIPNHKILFLASQALIYYCWSQAFSSPSDSSDIHIQVSR